MDQFAVGTGRALVRHRPKALRRIKRPGDVVNYQMWGQFGLDVDVPGDFLAVDFAGQSRTSLRIGVNVS